MLEDSQVFSATKTVATLRRVYIIELKGAGLGCCRITLRQRSRDIAGSLLMPLCSENSNRLIGVGRMISGVQRCHSLTHDFIRTNG